MYMLMAAPSCSRYVAMGGKSDNLLLQFAIILLNSFYVFINLNFLLLCDLLEYIYIRANQDERVFLLHFIDFPIVRCNCTRKVLAVECIAFVYGRVCVYDGVSIVNASRLFSISRRATLMALEIISK